MFDLRDVVASIAKRVGFIPGRVWFGAGVAINMTLTGNQPRNFLRFLNRPNLSYFLVSDGFNRKQPRRVAVLTGRGESTWVDPRRADCPDNQFCLQFSTIRPSPGRTWSGLSR